jgi:hypothetical protein
MQQINYSVTQNIKKNESESKPMRFVLATQIQSR